MVCEIIVINLHCQTAVGAAAVSVVLFIYIFILRSLYYIVFKSPEYDRGYNIHIFILYWSPSFSFNGYYTLFLSYF